MMIWVIQIMMIRSHANPPELLLLLQSMVNLLMTCTLSMIGLAFQI